jgi:outer membrane protein OmpA-like peptidoglycan-associated protein
MLHCLLRHGTVVLAACVVLSAAPALAAGDPCAGGLGAARIVDCLKPDGMGSQTRGIRPTAPKPGAPASQAAPVEHASVNLVVPFGYDSAEMTPQGMKALDALATALKDPALATVRFEIGGHTDATGTDDYNLKLSERRAEAARAYLLEKGVDAARLTAVGYGRTRLYNAAAPTAAVNRRVQVTRLD